MANYFVKLRYYPGDPLEEMKEEDLEGLEKDHGVTISYEKIESREMKDGLLMENTLDKRIEDISQEVITVSSDRETNFSNCIRALYKKKISRYIILRLNKSWAWISIQSLRRTIRSTTWPSRLMDSIWPS